MVKDSSVKSCKRIISALSIDVHREVVTEYPPSIVDSSQFESLADIVAKYNRGEPILSSSRVDSISMDPESLSPEDAIADMSVMRESGADIVDASAALRSGEEARTRLRKDAKAKADKDKADQDAKFKADADELEAARAAKRAQPAP